MRDIAVIAHELVKVAEFGSASLDWEHLHKPENLCRCSQAEPTARRVDQILVLGTHTSGKLSLTTPTRRPPNEERFNTYVPSSLKTGQIGPSCLKEWGLFGGFLAFLPLQMCDGILPAGTLLLSLLLLAEPLPLLSGKMESRSSGVDNGSTVPA